MDIQKLIERLQAAFTDQDKYRFDKHVPEFSVDSKFLGDCFSQIIVEPKKDKPPRFYHTFSPFDVISKKAPDHALVFENGELLYNADFTDAVVSRTAAMDALVLKALGVTTLKDKRILLVGSGKVAQRSLQFLSEVFEDLRYIDCLSRTGDISSIADFGKQFDIEVQAGSVDRLDEYDIILFHTNTDAQILSGEHVDKIKQGAIITSFISSTEHGELPDDFYNSTEANIIVDWPLTITTAKDLSRSIQAGTVKEADIITIEDLLTKTRVSSSKRYTIYRTVGTPIQNLAILQLLVK